MKKKNLIIFIVLAVIVITSFYIYSEFKGNPFIKLKAREEINDYLTTHFTDIKYTKSDIRYNFKDGTYNMDIDVKKSEDNDFTISYRNGEIKNDYEWRVINKMNISNRLQIYLNENRDDKILEDIFGNNYNFSLIKVYEEAWENNPPYNDMPIADMLKNYPLEMTIYLHSNEGMSEARCDEIKKQVFELYKDRKIILSNIMIEY